MSITFRTDNGQTGSVSGDYRSRAQAVLVVAESMLTGISGPQTITHVGTGFDTSVAVPTRVNNAAYRQVINEALLDSSVPAANLVIAAGRYGTAPQQRAAQQLLDEVRGTGGGGRTSGSANAASTGGS